MNYLVTGGLGFIGSHISRHLVETGEEVYVLDNLHTGNKANLARGATLHNGSVDELNGLKLPNIDVVYHEGIYSSTPMYKKDRRLVSKSIAEFIELLEFCRKEEAKLIFASTSSVYNGVPTPQSEDAAIPVTDFYTEARYSMERLAQVYSNEYGMGVVGLRYFSVYGPGEEHKKTYANLISQIMWAALADKPFQVYGNGEQTRDFTYIDDIVSANRLAEGYGGFGIFNVGTGKSSSINEVVKKMEKVLGREIEIEYVENPLNNYVEHTCADTTKAEKALGFKAKTSLEDGIKKCLEYAQTK